MEILGLVLALIPLIAVVLIGGQMMKTRALARAAENAVPQVGQIVKVRGGAIHYVDRGPRDAPVLVMIHGLGGYLQHFTYAVSGLMEADYRVIVIDRPGCGYSQRSSDDLAALPEQARMIGEALDALGIKRATVVGHSLGGAVSLALALDRPKLVASLALICPLTAYEDGEIEAFKGINIPSPFMRRLLATTVAVPMAQKKGAETLNMVFAPEPWPEDFVIRAGGVLGMRPQSIVATSADYVMSHKTIAAQEARYGADLKAPGGVLFGAEDALLAPEKHGANMQAHGLEFETLPDRGHMIPITAPEACADFIRRMAAKTA
ncbi:alpha/beta fold hydrolase [Chachezhania antarctica]|uniref:alpha/beta fold hydrolase n=1 Tax=Chachezhania antarctica TaxID=2340860 RepID=UPI000EACA0DD|nr:alpha/beta fold hydrolase [Chachezhania antarctica]|tara:strand:+ start:5102 stop:6061 length:960 start_codon:yes stop_codon:yes gene_type:complete